MRVYLRDRTVLHLGRSDLIVLEPPIVVSIRPVLFV
jgi:hypothetical protein